MLKSICIQTPQRLLRVAWLSLQPDGSISFGLQDKTFIVSEFKTRHMIWNAHNRVRIRYAAEAEDDSVEPISNPHFTYHPALMFQLTAGPSGRSKKFLFRGIADVVAAVRQDGHMPWLHATTAALTRLPAGSLRANVKSVEVLCVASPSEDCSVTVEVDFVPPQEDSRPTASTWVVGWRSVCLRLRVGLTFPQPPLLSWFHSY